MERRWVTLAALLVVIAGVSGILFDLVDPFVVVVGLLAAVGVWVVGREGEYWRRGAGGGTAGAGDREQSGPPPRDYLAAAKQARERAEAAMSDGEYATAADAYEEAASHYGAAREQLSADDDRHSEIDTSLQQVQSAHERAVQHRDRRAELRDQLAAAEDDLATALREHAQGNATVARVRYRQARDRYEESLQQVENEMLEPALSVQISGDDRPSLEAVAGLTEQMADRLRSHDYGTPAELNDSSIEALTSIDGIDEEIAARLLAWGRIPADDTQTFETRRDINERQAHAIVGFQQCQ